MTAEDEVRAAAVRFYEAIEAMVTGKGLDLMRDAWHHTDRVTTAHPIDFFAEGWDQVWATWQVFSGFGAEGRGGSSMSNLHVYVYGDFAYSTCVFKASEAFGGETLACTNVFLRKDGAWKVIHHHADKAPKMGAALERLAGG